MSDLIDIIRREIAAAGVISFARFMALALYCPRYGYYERQSKQIGCQGDFHTSVQVGAAFGELLALRFRHWLRELDPVADAFSSDLRQGASPPALEAAPRGRTSPLQLIEAGAHDGQLALDVLDWLEHHDPALLAKLEYWILEPSPERQSWQAGKLAKFSSQVRWFPSWNGLPDRSVHGIIFSNELLDAFPVHRVGWDAAVRSWFEWGVIWAENQFQWRRISADSTPLSQPPESPVFPILAGDLLAVLPNGFTTEVAPAAERWWGQAARALRRGYLMTIDYGIEGEDFFRPERAHGTLRAYSRHHTSPDLLAAPGEQDLTAHVNFTALRRAGEAAGLSTTLFTSQARFLTNILEQFGTEEGGLAAWTPERLRQFKTLVHPEHFGRPFSVLVQSRR